MLRSERNVWRSCPSFVSPSVDEDDDEVDDVALDALEFALAVRSDSRLVRSVCSWASRSASLEGEALEGEPFEVDEDAPGGGPGGGGVPADWE